MDWIVLLIIVVAYAVFFLSRMIYTRTFLKALTEDEFRAGYRKAQLIDVREPNEFNNGHILGARNIPITQMRNRLIEIRKDKPVYLYCDNSTRSKRAAALLKRKGYKDLNYLKGGFKKWTGRTKSK